MGFLKCVLRALRIDPCAAAGTCGFVAPSTALFRPDVNYRPYRTRILRMTRSTEPKGRVQYGVRIETRRALSDNFGAVVSAKINGTVSTRIRLAVIRVD